MDMPADFRYERYAPDQTLAAYVEHFWIVDATVGPEPRREILIPDGRPMVLVCLGDPGRRIWPRDGSSTADDSGYCGIATGPIVIEQRGLSRYVAAQLRPFGLAALYGRPLVDAAAPLAGWSDAELASVADAGFGEPAVRRLEAILVQRLRPLPPDRLARLTTAVAAIDAAGGNIEVDALCRQTGVDYDRLYRDFRATLGISAKQLIALTRYQQFVGGLLRTQPVGGLAQLTLLQGYYDQAHANRDFRRYTGVTPATFQRELNGIARLMHQP